MDMTAQSQRLNYMESLTAKLKEHNKVVSKALCAVDRVMAGAEVNESKIPSLLRHTDKVEQEHEKLCQAAHRFGCAPKALAKKRKAMSQEVE